MTSTYSPLLRIELISTGAQAGLWGNTTNTNLGTLIEQAIAGTATVSVTSGNVTLTESNGVSDQSRCAAILVTGSAGVSRNVVAPASSKLYVVSNTADAAIVLKTSGSTGLTIPSGVTIFAYYNGTDFIAVSQPYDADLTAIADLATTGIIVRSGSGTAVTRTITASTGITVTNGSGVSGNPTIEVSTVPVANGGTNITSYTTGDIIYASGTTTLSKLADVATGNALISGGVGVAPSWGKIGLTTHITGTLAVANGGTGVTTSTGSGNVVLSDSPTLVTPVLGTPASGTLTNCTGLPVATGISGLGSGVATFLATPSSSNLKAAVTDETGSGALVFATSPTLVTPILGTPTSGTLTNCTGLPVSTGIAGLGTGVATFLATPSSANLAAAVTDETGSGALVFGTSPTLTTPTLSSPTMTTPVLGTPASGTLTNCTGLPMTTGVTGTLPIANGGTNATTASGARTSLGLAIGTDVQAYDADLTAIAGLSSTGMISRTGAGTAAVRTITASTGISVSNGDGVSGNPTITNTGVTSLTAGTAISVSASTGGITVTNTGVTSAVAGSGISVSAATGAVTFTNTGVLKSSSTGAAYLPSGSTSDRPVSASSGYFRFNSSIGRFEGYNGSNWGSVGGATGGGTDAIFYENGQNVTTDYTITSGTNAMSAGDITIDTGVTVTVPDGSNWVIV